MYTALMLLTALATAAFLVTLLVFVFQITDLLQRIGGRPTSLLAKLRLGLRAIEGETGHLPPLLERLNQDLGMIAEGLGAAHADLEDTIAAAVGQERSRQ